MHPGGMFGQRHGLHVTGWNGSGTPDTRLSLTNIKNLTEEYMETPRHHIMVCASFRPTGEPKGKCHRKHSLELLPYIENEIIDRDMDGVVVSSTCCLKMCDQGPVMIIYPENIWYGGVETEGAVDDILDALEDGEIATGYQL